MSKKPEGVADPVMSGQVDLEELILGKDEYAKRRAAFPDGFAPKARKLTAEDRAAIRSAKYVKISELAKHFKVSTTTIGKIRNG